METVNSYNIHFASFITNDFTLFITVGGQWGSAQPGTPPLLPGTGGRAPEG